MRVMVSSVAMFSHVFTWVEGAEEPGTAAPAVSAPPPSATSVTSPSTESCSLASDPVTGPRVKPFSATDSVGAVSEAR